MLSASICFGQLSISDVENQKISWPPIEDYLVDQQNKSILHFQDFKASWHQAKDSAEFYTYQKVYLIKESIEKVWNVYASTSPNISWKTDRCDFGLLYDRNQDSLLYADDKIPALCPGNVLFINLKLFKGLYQMATAFEVTKVSSEQRFIEMSYIETGVARGKQLIKLEATENGYTKVTHITRIKSGSKFRDRVAYPFFHNKIIKEFHKKMRRMAMEESRAIAEL
jgi:hypothetical protein